MNVSYLLRTERCPQCAKLGKDLHGDNLAVYSDGHSFCYSCGYTRSSKSLISFKGKAVDNNSQLVARNINMYLPSDCDVSYPSMALQWIGQYELTRNDLLNHHVLWSEKVQRLIFPIFGDGELLAWQGRSFDKDRKKWYTIGKVEELFHILGKGNEIILVEDVISAIKISKVGHSSMCLFGSNISIERFKHLSTLTKEVAIYLDPDKRKESLKFNRRASLVGLKSRVIFSANDPKEETFERLKEILK